MDLALEIDFQGPWSNAVGSGCEMQVRAAFAECTFLSVTGKTISWQHQHPGRGGADDGITRTESGRHMHMDSDFPQGTVHNGRQLTARGLFLENSFPQ